MLKRHHPLMVRFLCCLSVTLLAQAVSAEVRRPVAVVYQSQNWSKLDRQPGLEEANTEQSNLLRDARLGETNLGETNTARLLVANSRSGTITSIDLSSLSVTEEQSVASQLADLIETPQGLVVLDPSQHQLKLLQADTLEPLQTLDLPVDPRRGLFVPEHERLIVSSGWSRTITVLQRERSAWQVEQEFILPYPPQEMVLLPDGRHVVVADAFAGELAVLDVQQAKVVVQHTLPVHNMRGLAISANQQQLYITHQLLDSQGTTHFDHLTWGEFITNGILSIPVDALLKKEVDLIEVADRELLGTASDSGGDPGELLVHPSGKMWIAMTGSGNVGVADSEFTFLDIEVGRGPVAMAVDEEQQQLFVANRFDDSVTVVDLQQRLKVATISLGATEETAVDRGEQLFFDARLANDRWMSCHSCHSQGHTNEAVVDTLGDGDFGAPKRVPSLLGIRESAPYAWDGSLKTLEQQIRKSVKTTLHGVDLSDKQVKELSAYLNSLQPPPARQSLPEGTMQTARLLFEQKGCAECHSGNTFTSAKSFDVGLPDELGRRRFNPPSLRAVSQRRRLLHDGSANLSQVLKVHPIRLGIDLTDSEQQQLLTYLQSLP